LAGVKMSGNWPLFQPEPNAKLVFSAALINSNSMTVRMKAKEQPAVVLGSILHQLCHQH